MRYVLGLVAAIIAAWSFTPSASAQGATKTASRPPTGETTQSRPPEPRATDKRASMKVVLVRSSQPGCEPDCPEWIAAQGQIDSTTPEEFRRVLAKLGPRKVPVLIDSIGGEVEASLIVGRMIRARGLDVVVTKTIIEPCDPAQAACKTLKARGFETGRPEPRISKCASACAFVLAGGVHRYVGAWTVVGLHEIKSVSTLRLVRQHYRIERRTPWSEPSETKRRLVKEEVLKVETKETPAEEATYERVRRYFVEMGIDPSIMAILRAAPNSSIRWVKVAELKSTGLGTDFLNGEQLLAGPRQPGGTIANSTGASAGTPAAAQIGAQAGSQVAAVPSTAAAPIHGQGPVQTTTGALASPAAPAAPTAPVSRPSASTTAAVITSPIAAKPKRPVATAASANRPSAAPARAAPFPELGN